MRVGGVRFGRLAVAVAVSVALTTLGGAAAAAKPAGVAAATPAAVKHAFKVTIYPAYTTAGLPTTFEIKVANASASGTTLKSVQLTPPTGFTLSQPAAKAPLRRKTLVRRRTVSLRQISVKAGSKVEFDVTATAAPKTCGTTVRRWTSRAFEGATASGPQLALQSALSSLGVTVVCQKPSPCGQPGMSCTDTETTNLSTYTASSTAASGTLTGGVDVGRRLTCAGYQPRDRNWYDSIVGNGPSAVSYEIQYTLDNATTYGLEVCMGLPYEFTTLSGANAPSAKLPNGKPGFVGLLPTCAAVPTGPCVSSVTPTSSASGTTGGVFVTAQIPPAPVGAPAGDPWMGP